ncbi:MarR family winged helix-turn-helix transcriptional regulator [Treponema sp. Marseille-Q4130]|uniref:MarR family winged helix-turn-helix transcriptional regulator n=1 Tax=Treponema sp. Marseille-Q4130 TaxID=2766702 RepID=UPI002107892F|nr:MarR family transcriptional regulator [Treponema sp. Marseille-Q4130]
MNTDIRQSMSLVSRIHSAAADFLIKRLAEKGLPDFASSHGFILFQLAAKDALSMKELAEKINRDKSTATVLVRKLERDGFVKTAPSPADARSKLVSLTSKGKRYNDVTAELANGLLKIFYKGFSEDEKKKAFAYLTRIAENFPQ